MNKYAFTFSSKLGIKFVNFKTDHNNTPIRVSRRGLCMFFINTSESLSGDSEGEIFL